MPRQGRIQSGTGVYHVMMRGINRQQIFESDEDNKHMLYVLSNLHLQYSPDGMPLPSPTCMVYAYCLMGNYIHLLIQEKAWTIGEIIKSLASSYVYYFNRQYQRIGHLFQDRFKSEPVNDMTYFVTLLRYIHQNPVKAGIVRDAKDYQWSLWREYLSPDRIENICNTRATLRRISIEELAALVNKPPLSTTAPALTSTRQTYTPNRYRPTKASAVLFCACPNVRRWQNFSVRT